MNFEGYPVFGFNFDKVGRYVDNLITGNEKLEYLSCIQKVIRCADAVGHRIPDDFRDRLAQKVVEFAGATFTAQRIIKQASQETSQDDIISIFKGAPLYGFDVQALELNLNNLPTLEQQAAYILNILQEYNLAACFAIANQFKIPEEYRAKLGEIVSLLKLELALRGGEKQQRALEGIRNGFDFDKVKQHLETLPDIRARIRYLIEIKTEYEQQDVLTQIQFERFDQKCDLEIKKLEKVVALEQASQSQRESQDEKEKRSKGGSRYQNLLALYYLLHYLRANNNNSKKAKFASFLTGFSPEPFRQQLSNIHWKRDENGVAWQKDMKVVQGFFQELGLPEQLIKQIDNDLEF